MCGVLLQHMAGWLMFVTLDYAHRIIYVNINKFPGSRKKKAQAMRKTDQGNTRSDDMLDKQSVYIQPVENRSTTMVMTPSNISIPMSAITICSSRSPCRLVTDSLRSLSMSCRTSTLAFKRSILCGSSK